MAPQEQFLRLSTIFYNPVLDFCVITRTRFFLRDKRLFEITEVEITRVDCIFFDFKIKEYTVNSRYLEITEVEITRVDCIFFDFKIKEYTVNSRYLDFGYLE